MSDNWKVGKVNTVFRSENIGGIRLSVFKSALQKFLRRDECNMGMGTLKIISNFDDGTPNGRKIITNIINRLVVMMSEEVCINNAALPVVFKQFYGLFNETRDFKVLYILYKELCDSKKCRLLSDLKTRFNLMPYYLDDKVKLQQLHMKLIEGDEKLTKLYSLTINAAETLNCIETELSKKSYDTYLYVSYYMWNNYMAGSGGQKLWNVVIRCASSVSEETNDVVKALKYFYNELKHNERPLYLYQAILTIIHSKELDLKPLVVKSFVLKRYLQFPLTAGKFPDYVYDIHTGNNNKTIVDFALEGAYTNNEDNKFKCQSWRDNYIKFKRMLNGESSFSDDTTDSTSGTDSTGDITDGMSGEDKLSAQFMFDCIRGQKLTSSSKPFVYIPTDRSKYENMVGFVYKGPYTKSTRREFVLSQRSSILKHMNTLHVLFPQKISNNNDIWFKYKYIGDLDNIAYNEEHDNISDTDIKVLMRVTSGVKQFSTLSDEDIYNHIFGPNMLILSLVDLMILNAGDMGFWNILLSYDGSPWLVDIEDTRALKRDPKSAFVDNIFIRPMKANHRNIFVKGIKEFGNVIQTHLQSRKNADLMHFEEYWTYIGRDPNETIEYLLSLSMSV